MTPSVKQPLLAGKHGLVLGVANDRSIAWQIARAAADHGAVLALTYQNEVLEKRVRPLAQSANDALALPCDVEREEHLDALAAELKRRWGRLDFLVHSLAWANRDNLKGAFLDVSRADFLRAMEVSCYSLTALLRRVAPLMSEGASVLTLSYYGAEKVIPHYNVMGVAKAALEASVRYLAVDLGRRGIRVNAMSAGPLRTLAASAIGDFRYIFKWNERNAPLRRNVANHDIAGSALYLLSGLSSGVTGEVHHVDCGYHVVGMKDVEAPDLSIVREA